MKKIQTILAPTDFSENSLPGVEYARDLAREMKAKVVLVHVSPSAERLVVYGPPPANIPKDLEAAVEQGVAAGFRDLLKRFDDTDDVLTEHLRGDPHEELISHARDHDVDLIVMATHGHTGLKHMLLGSIAEKVVRTASCPVLTVRSAG